MKKPLNMQTTKIQTIIGVKPLAICEIYAIGVADIDSCVPLRKPDEQTKN